MADEVMIVEILNWEKYQGRTDVKNPSWFKLSHNVFYDHVIMALTLEERAVWFYLLCEASRSEKRGYATVNSEVAHRVSGISKNLLHRVVSKLTSYRMVTSRTLRGRYAHVTRTCTREEEIRLEKRREEENMSSGDDAPPLGVLGELWNRETKTLPKVKGMSGTRRRLAEARWKDHPQEDYWVAVIRSLESSDFCTGKNDRGWRANFDFFIRPDTHLKVQEGAYGSPTKSGLSDWEKSMLEKDQ